jgi:hypothetical protein
MSLPTLSRPGSQAFQYTFRRFVTVALVLTSAYVFFARRWALPTWRSIAAGKFLVCEDAIT